MFLVLVTPKRRFAQLTKMTKAGYDSLLQSNKIAVFGSLFVVLVSLQFALGREHDFRTGERMK